MKLEGTVDWNAIMNAVYDSTEQIIQKFEAIDTKDRNGSITVNFTIAPLGEHRYQLVTEYKTKLPSPKGDTATLAVTEDHEIVEVVSVEDD